MAWYGEELLPGRASGELTGFQATVYQRRYAPESGPADQPAEALWGFYYGGPEDAAPQVEEAPVAAPVKAPAAVPPAPAPATCKSALTKARSICIAVGDDCCTDKVLKYAAKYICKPVDTVTLVHMSKSGVSTAQGAAGGKRSSSKGAAACREQQLLDKARQTLLQTGKVVEERLSTAIIPATKHVGQSLVAHCQHSGYYILIIGCRGLTGMKAKMDSLMGEGSVSKYCVEHLTRMAVVVVKPPLGHDWGKS